MIHIERPFKFTFFVFILLLVIGLGFFAGGRFLLGPGQVLKGGTLEIAEGTSASGVWKSAVEQGFTANDLAWRYNSWRQNAAGNIKAGSYELNAGEKIPDVINRLMRGEAISDDLTMTYPEGFTLEQIAARTAARGISTSEEIIQNAQPGLFSQEFSFLADIPPGRDLEGYLFPDTYQFSAEASAKDVVQRLVANFARRVTPQMRGAASSSGHTLDDVIIMASIIEREVQSDEDMAMVSGVLWKRLDEGIGLAADATTRYALAKWDGALTVDDLAIDSPYNTRQYRGLPPGPISNPGLRAITAAIYPEPSEFYYYLSTPEGETIFGRTNYEHNANKAKYLR